MVEYLQSALDCITSWPWAAVGQGLKSYVLPLAAPAAAFYVAYKFGQIQAEIGKKQAATAALAMDTARTKLRLDLFDKRLAVYEAVNKVIEAASAKGALDAQDQAEYLLGIRAAPWLFDEDVNSYLAGLSSLVHRLVEVMPHIAKEEHAAYRQTLTDRKTDWFIEICGVYGPRLPSVMAPYLRFINRSEM